MSNWLQNAINKYGNGGYAHPDQKRNVNAGAKRIDCSKLVNNILKEAGYTIGDRESTAALNDKYLKNPNNYGEGQKYYTTVSPADMRPGDLIVFKGHVGIVTETPSYDPLTGKPIPGKFFGSQSSTGPKEVDFGKGAGYWNDKRFPYIIIRPKPEYSPAPDYQPPASQDEPIDPNTPLDIPPPDGDIDTTRDPFHGAEAATYTPPPVDPMILDINGDGIKTTNVKDGAYFDHDGNGFAEKTGLAAPDDGMLVMDRNGDGIINDGKELFGDQTILSNGTRATNGFQALSDLDSNADGKVDINDSAFANLKIWQDIDGDGYKRQAKGYRQEAIGNEILRLAA